MLFIRPYFWFPGIFLGLMMALCPNSEEGKPVLKAQERVNEELLKLNPNEGIVNYKGKPFSGVGIKAYPNGQVAEEITYQNGKRNGRLERWFENGDLSFEAFYENNRLNGKLRSWWINGHLRSESNYKKGVVHGLQKQWYSSGRPFKELNIVNGKEEGLQRAWRENGDLFVNYEAKNGRIFGLNRANLCYELEGENIVTDE